MTRNVEYGILQTMKRKKAVITGASRGIGRAVAQVLASHSYDLLITGKDPDRLAKAVTELSQSAEVYSIAADMLDPDTPEMIINRAEEVLGGIDLLVNNAGMSFAAPIEESTLADWEQVMTVNARAPFFLSKAALPLLRKSDSPVIIQIGSVVSIKGYENQSIYSASKHALAGLTKVLAREVYHEGIRVHLIMPGGVGTEMSVTMRPDIASNEMITPEEIGEIVLFLAERTGKGVIDEIQIHRETKAPWD